MFQEPNFMGTVLDPGRNCLGLYDVHYSGLLVDGVNYFSAFYRQAGLAERSILLAGWQFDSRTRLLQGMDPSRNDLPLELLDFLTALCRKKPNLSIHILAWDFSVFFSLDREWLQGWLFDWSSCPRLQFRFDANHPVGASHHLKLAVIDGRVAFVGGIDICEHRWDDRKHLAGNPQRLDAEGRSYEPYHDVQAVVYGKVAAELEKLFHGRWLKAGGDPIEPSASKGRTDEWIPPAQSLPITAARVAVSRTRGRTILPLQTKVREIRSLYLDAIASAEQLIYIENQYFSSRAIFQALEKRMRQADRSKLQIIFIFPRDPQAMIEKIALGQAQVGMFHTLLKIAEEQGHRLGLYWRAVADATPLQDTASVYIHAKLMIVDDSFLTVGSANLNNRSMGLDSELNLSWEADPEEEEGIESIRACRVDLLEEHTGTRHSDQNDLRTIDGLTVRLDKAIERGDSNLRFADPVNALAQAGLLEGLHLEDLGFDPEEALIEDGIYELIFKDESGFFAEGINALNRFLEQNPDAGEKQGKKDGKPGRKGRMAIGLWLLAGLLAGVLILLFLLF
jgi:phospholipase D1/2